MRFLRNQIRYDQWLSNWLSALHLKSPPNHLYSHLKAPLHSAV